TILDVFSTGSSTHNAIIGAARGNSGSVLNWLSGAVDDLQVYDRPLNQQEINRLASGQTPQEIDAMNQQPAEVASRGLAHYDYGFRIYNPALGRFLSVDPLTATYPMLTPYQFASNTPIQAIDLDGLEAKIIVNSQYNIRRITKLFHPSSSDINKNINKQMALAIVYYSTEASYPNDAHTRMYPDINFPESGLAAEGSVDNSFEGVQIWGTIGTDENGNNINVLLGTVDREEGFFEQAFDIVRGGKTRDASDFEKILIENFDQETIKELANAFGPDETQEYLKFLKEKGVIEENTVRGGRGFGPILNPSEERRGDTTFTYHGNYRIDGNDTLYNYQDIPIQPERDDQNEE
ncbi:MAG: RHS repeat-associated core domain-containing protein, partial [Bacteroidota bacterium]